MPAADSASSPFINLYAVDAARNRYPFCIVWSPLPLLTAFFPFIGHLGIADSTGVIYDFAGSFHIGKEHFAFGNPTRYIQFSIRNAEAWDSAIAYANTIYRQRPHQICSDNCHSHVATALNRLGTRQFSMFRLCTLVFFKGKFVSLTAFLKSVFPTIVLLILIHLYRNS